MSDTIEEIQSKKRRDAGLQAWAEMLERIQARQNHQASPVEESSQGGGASLPRTPIQRPDARQALERKLRLEAIQASMASLQTDAQRMKDIVQVSPTPSQAPRQAEVASKTLEAPQQLPQPEVRQPETPQPEVSHSEVSQPEVHQREIHQQEVRHQEKVQADVQQQEIQATQAQILEAEAPLMASNVEATEKLLELSSQAGIQQTTAQDKLDEFSPEDTQAAIQEALQLMALKSGANPALAAKDYVLASELPGVKDSLTGGVFEDFRVAL